MACLVLCHNDSMDQSFVPPSPSPDAPAPTKAQLRRLLRSQLGRGPIASMRVLDLLNQLGARAVASYQPLSHELNVNALNDALRERFGPLWLPVVSQATGSLDSLPIGFRQDADGQPQLDIDLDAMLLPALAIDTQGVRLGQGGGWYDRVVALIRRVNPQVVLIGCVPSSRFVAPGLIPREAHDVTVDYVVTEDGWRRCTALVPNQDNPQGSQ